MPKENLTLYIATKRKVVLPKEDFLQTHYLDITKKKKLMEAFQKNKKSTWLISDTIHIINLAATAQYKTIFLANGAEKDWDTTPAYSFITASIQQARDLLYLIHSIN